MKILFSNLPWWERREGRFFGPKKWRAGVRAGSRWPFTSMVNSSPDKPRPGDYLPYPFFMGYATTYVARQTGAETLFRDSIALRDSYKTFYSFLKKHHPDWIFIESATPSWEHDAGVIREIARQFPEINIAVTGPITSIKAEDILSSLPVKACIRGEYEKGAVRAINGTAGIIEHDLLTAAEMNASPFPYWDEAHAHLYFDTNPIGQQFPHAHVWSSRGCPFKCIFCVWPATMTGNDPDGAQVRTVRHYSAEYMYAYLSELVGKYHFRSIYFDDDTFNLGNTHTLRMCEVMRHIGLPWSSMCRADTIKMETWKEMKESGCFGVKLGFESGNQYVVDQIVNKHLNLEKAREVVHHLKQLGMTVHGTFTYGLPGETKEQMLDTKRYIASLPLTTFQESGTAEIEGTPLHTLRQRGTLEAYAGAHIDTGYDKQVDGSKKWDAIIRSLVQG